MVEDIMLREIKEQPEVIKRLAADKDSHAMLLAADLLGQAKATSANIYLVGNGSSYHACIYGQHILSKHAGIIAHLVNSGEFTPFADNLRENDVVILVSQSGETGDARRLISNFKSKISNLIVITNYPESTLGQAADIVLPMLAGVCQAVPNTKGYTASMTIFALLADGVRGSDDFVRHVNTIDSDISRIIQTEYDRLVAISDKLSSSKNIFVLAHGAGLANAYEAALKIKECSHIEAEGYSALEFRHGHSSVVSQGTPIIVFMADYESETDLSPLLDIIGQPDPYIIGFGSVDHKQFDQRFDAFEHDLYSTIPAIVPVQILAYELALSRGINPDSPGGVMKIVE